MNYKYISCDECGAEIRCRDNGRDNYLMARVIVREGFWKSRHGKTVLCKNCSRCGRDHGIPYDGIEESICTIARRLETTDDIRPIGHVMINHRIRTCDCYFLKLGINELKQLMPDACHKDITRCRHCDCTCESGRRIMELMKGKTNNGK